MKKIIKIFAFVALVLCLMLCNALKNPHSRSDFKNVMRELQIHTNTKFKKINCKMDLPSSGSCEFTFDRADTNNIVSALGLKQVDPKHKSSYNYGLKGRRIKGCIMRDTIGEDAVGYKNSSVRRVKSSVEEYTMSFSSPERSAWVERFPGGEAPAIFNVYTNDNKGCIDISMPSHFM